MSKESDLAAAAALRQWADRAVQQIPIDSFSAPKALPVPNEQVSKLRTAAARAERHELSTDDD